MHSFLPVFFPLFDSSDEPCGNSVCSVGARCSRPDLRCSCDDLFCPEETTSAGGGPAVCGSDGEAYESECHLMKEACKRQQHILIVAYQSCSCTPILSFVG